MPFYDFKCDDCDTIFEVHKSMNDKRKPLCPRCESRFNKRIFNTFTGNLAGSACTACSDGVCSTCSVKS